MYKMCCNRWKMWVVANCSHVRQMFLSNRVRYFSLFSNNRVAFFKLFAASLTRSSHERGVGRRRDIGFRNRASVLWNGRRYPARTGCCCAKRRPQFPGWHQRIDFSRLVSQPLSRTLGAVEVGHDARRLLSGWLDAKRPSCWTAVLFA
jgi:hypothetical protein